MEKRVLSLHTSRHPPRSIADLQRLLELLGQALDPPADNEPEYFWQTRSLDEIAHCFLRGADDDRCAASRILDEIIDVLFSGGVFHTWKYRSLLARLREGF
jgi:hypothetical protein